MNTIESFRLLNQICDNLNLAIKEKIFINGNLNLMKLENLLYYVQKYREWEYFVRLIYNLHKFIDAAQVLNDWELYVSQNQNNQYMIRLFMNTDDNVMALFMQGMTNIVFRTANTSSLKSKIQNRIAEHHIALAELHKILSNM